VTTCDEGRGEVKNRPKSRDVIYGRPLIPSQEALMLTHIGAKVLMFFAGSSLQTLLSRLCVVAIYQHLFRVRSQGAVAMQNYGLVINNLGRH